MKRQNTKYGCIYLLTNKKNGRRYVGKDQTGDPERHRWKVHIKEALNGNSQYPLYRAIRKAGGPEGFTAEIIWRGPVEKLCAKEVFYVKKLHSYVRDPLGDGSYNQTIGGDGAPGAKWNETARKQRSLLMIARFAVPENKTAHIKIMNKPETKARMSVVQKRRFEKATKKELVAFGATCSASQLRRYEDPRAHEVQREGQAKRFADPVKHAENAAAHRTPEFVTGQSERGKKKWRNKKWREDWIAANTTPEAHEKKSRIGKDWHADPAAQARFLSGVKSTACSERHSTSGIKWYSVPKNHKKHLATHRTPEFRALKSANTKAFWDTMTPEERSIWWREVRAAKLKKK